MTTFLDSRTEILEIISLLFWKNLSFHKDITKLTDLWWTNIWRSGRSLNWLLTYNLLYCMLQFDPNRVNFLSTDCRSIASQTSWNTTPKKRFTNHKKKGVKKSRSSRSISLGERAKAKNTVKQFYLISSINYAWRNNSEKNPKNRSKIHIPSNIIGLFNHESTENCHNHQNKNWIQSNLFGGSIILKILKVS